MDASFRPSVGHHFSVAVVHLDLRLHGCLSLKEKRGRLARITGHLTKLHPVVVSEVGEQDAWGRTALAAVTIASSRAVVEQTLEAVIQTLEREPQAELLWSEVEHLY